jgi:hypothetical protein
MLPDLSGPWAKLETRHQEIFSNAAAGQLKARHMQRNSRGPLGRIITVRAI